MDSKELARLYRERVEAEIRKQPVRWAPKQPLDFRVLFGTKVRTMEGPPLTGEDLRAIIGPSEPRRQSHDTHNRRYGAA